MTFLPTNLALTSSLKLDSFLSLTPLSSAKRTATFDMPNDVLVDGVLPYLSFRDILRLRRVCKHFYDITRHAAVWKRLLQSSELVMPPLPPTPRFALANLTALEAERLYLRTHSLEINWKQDSPEPVNLWSFNSPYRIAEMVLIPGGQYLVASVSDADKSRWEILLCSVDPRKGVLPIAKTSTITKAYNLQARYLTVGSVPGITIAYIRRDWLHRTDGMKGINISDYGAQHDIDHPYEVKHECIALHVSLESTEELLDTPLLPGSQAFAEKAKTLPPPFKQLSYIRSRSRKIASIVLDTFGLDDPYLVVVKQPDSILFKPLNGGHVVTLRLTLPMPFASLPRAIEAIRPLPQQNQILVVLRITPLSITTLFFKMYDIPAATSPEEVCVTMDPRHEAGFCLLRRHLHGIFISDPTAPRSGDLIERHQGDLDLVEPPPISLLISSTHLFSSLERFVLKPERVDTPSSRARSTSRYHYRYVLPHASSVQTVAATTGLSYRLLPGSHRMLAYTVLQEDTSEPPPILGLFKYCDQHISDGVPALGARISLRRIGLELLETSRISAMAWDDTIGRACFANDAQGYVSVIDFAHISGDGMPEKRASMHVPHQHNPEDCNPPRVADTSTFAI